MKTKILLSLVLLFCLVNASQAQINQGRYLLGGNFSAYNTTNPTGNVFNAGLQLGKVIKDNTVIGIIGSVATNSYSESNRPKIIQYSAGAFYRKYKPLGNNFNFLWELDGSYRHLKNYMYFSDVSQTLWAKSNGVDFSFVPGISYAISKRMQAELTMPNIANVSYYHIETIESYRPPTTPAQKANNFSANVNLNSSLLSNFGIGFKFLLGK